MMEKREVLYLVVGIFIVLGFFVLVYAVAPTINSVLLTTTNTSTNFTTENLTGYVSASDSDGDNITYIYNWYKNDAINRTTLITDGLLLYYPFDNDPYDYYGDINSSLVNGSYVNSSYGIKDGSAVFDGMNDYAVTSPITFNSKIITVSFWENISSFSDDNNMTMELSSNSNLNDGAFYITLNSGSPAAGKVAVSLQDSTSAAKLRLESFSRPSANSWHHYVFILNNTDTTGDIIAYVDGVEQVTAVNSNTKDQNSDFKTDNLYLMSRGGGALFNAGLIDEVMIFNRSLSATEIKELYFGGLEKLNVSSTYTSEGDTWKLGVKAADFTSISSEINSTGVHINSPLDLDSAPNITSVILNSTNTHTNSTIQNLTGYVSASDSDGDNITYIYNWYRNDTLNRTTLITDGLLSYYPFEGNANDYSGNGNNGTVYGGVSNDSSCVDGDCYSFDGVDGYIAIPDLDVESGNFTISGWINLDNLTGTYIAVQNSSNDRFTNFSNGSVCYGPLSGNIYSPEYSSDGESILNAGFVYLLTGNESYADSFKQRECTLTGNESYLWTCDVGMDYVDITPIDPDLNDVTVCVSYYENESCQTYQTFSYPSTFTMYIGQGNDKELSVSIPLNKGTLIAGKISQALDPYESYYQLFDNPILITPSTEYNTSDINVTQENKFAHLNLSDNSLVTYYPFDVQEDSNNITYDYSNNSNDGTLTNGVYFNSTDGKYGGDYQFDGVDDYIQSGTMGYENWTISTWINTNNLTIPTGEPYYGIMTIIQGDSSKELMGIKDTGLVVYVTLVGAYDFPNNPGWHNIIFEYNGTHVIGYVDGVNVGSVLKDNPFNSNITRMIGHRDASSTHAFNGSIDEVMVFNRSLTATEVAQIYNSTYSRFYPTGEMLFQNNNLGTNNTVNISIPNCQSVNGSYLQAKINDGSYVNFSSCNITNYPAEGNLTNANLTVKLISNNNFYSSLVVGNITLTSLDNTSSIVTITSPTNGSTVAGSSMSVSVTTDENATCNYSVDAGTTNYSLTSDSAGTSHTGTATGLSDGSYVLNVYCADLQGNVNNTQNVSFSVSIPVTASSSESSGNSNYVLGVYSPSESSLKNGYTVNVKAQQKVVVSSSDVTIESVSEGEVIVSVDGVSYTISDSSSTKIDLNNDGYYDVEIVNNGVTGEYANLEFTLINEAVPSNQQDSESGNVIDNSGSPEVSVGFWKSIGNFFSNIWDWISFWN